jgi:hypothetical protein
MSSSMERAIAEQRNALFKTTSALRALTETRNSDRSAFEKRWRAVSATVYDSITRKDRASWERSWRSAYALAQGGMAYLYREEIAARRLAQLQKIQEDNLKRMGG